MTLLGFPFGNRPNIDQHIALIEMKFNARSWLPRHLKNAGVPDADICNVYTTTIRSTMEYAVPVYHPLITSTQSEKLERLQRRALKTIFGFNIPYKETLERSGLDTLSERRDKIFKKFCIKTSENELFRHWLPLNTPSKYNLRREKKYKEMHAKTERLRKSPLHAMRRLLNSL